MTAGPNVEGFMSRGRKMTDWGQMQVATVGGVAQPNSEAELQDAIRYAAANNLKVSLRGAGHSAGGHSIRQDAIMIDMHGLNRVLDLDERKKTVRVQSGATWEDLTKVLEPLRLAITTKQEFETFTIGGSVAANVHGKSVDYGPLIEGIQSLRLLKADGEIVTASRDENADIFRAAIGGYGLLGVVVDVTFELVDDRPIEKTEVVYMKVEPLVSSYIERVTRDPQNTPLCYGFLDSEFERGFYLTYGYVGDDRQYPLDELKRDETNPTLFNLYVWLQYRSKFFRRRALQTMWASSNKPEVTLRSRRLLLWDHAPRAFGKVLLQKYFVPVANFLSFVRRAERIFNEYGDSLPVMTNHFRFVPGNSEALMSFSRQDTICLIPLYLAKKSSKRWVEHLERATDELLNACLDEGGSYYLTFDIIASKQQFQRAYPQWQEFLSLKKRHDPEEMFTSIFYEKYA